MSRRFSLAPLLPLALLVLAACAAPAAPSLRTPASTTVLSVLAASSLGGAFAEIGAAFEAAHPGTRVALSLAGSQQLRAQIEQGASADVFASADEENMQALQARQLIGGEPQILAHNRLIVILPKANSARVATLDDLARPGLKIVVADPSVPVGHYTLQFLDHLAADPAYGPKYRSRVLGQVVSQENNVSQVVAKVALGEADAGIAYTTDARAAPDKLATLEIPDAYNVQAAYSIAVLRSSANPTLSADFVAFTISSQGQAILARYGFAPR